VEGTYPPFSFYSKDNELAGFDVDVAKEIALRLDVTAKFVTVEWNKIISGLNAGEYDCIVASMAVTEARKKYVAFTEPYYYSSAQLIVRADASFNQPTDLKGLTIGVVSGTTYEADAKQLGAGSILFYKDDYQCLHELHLGVLDGVITDKVLGAYLENIGRFQFKLLNPPLRQEKVAVAIRKQDDALLRKLNKILKSMHKDDTLNGFISKVAQGDYHVGDPIGPKKP
jgi:polar amino acid transport system substrate-binding protein